MSNEYDFLASVLLSICPEEFSIGQINAELNEGHSKLSYSCTSGGEERYYSVDASRGWEVHKKLHSLRTEMTMPGQEPWSRCTFTLFPDGKFKFDVEYDD